MMFEFDPERLIEEVKQRPGIWNYEDVNYRSMVTRHELWDEVVRELLQPSVKVSKSEMRELILQLQKKWKSIKDAFQKYIQNPNRTRRPYLYCRQLQFLLKNQNLEIECGSSDSDNEPKRKKVRKTKQRVHIVKDEDEPTDHYTDNNMFNEVAYADEEDCTPTKTSRLTRPAVTDEFVFASTSCVETKINDSDDSDKMFLLSLLPHLKTIPEESRLTVKVELMHVLRNANFQNNNLIG